MKKRFLSIVLTLALVLSLMPGMTLSASAAGGETVWTASEYEFCPADGGANAKLVLTGVTSSDWNDPPENITIDLGDKFTNIESFEEAYGEDSYTLSMEPIDDEEYGYVEEGSYFSFRVVNEQHIISEMEVRYNDGTDNCVTLKYSVPEADDEFVLKHDNGKIKLVKRPVVERITIADDGEATINDKTYKTDGTPNDGNDPALDTLGLAYSYDATNGAKLTVNGVDMEGVTGKVGPVIKSSTAKNAISSEVDLEIELNVDTIVKCNDDDECHKAIDVSGDLKITGKHNLTATSLGDVISAENITIDVDNLTAVAKGDEGSGIIAEDTLSILGDTTLEVSGIEMGICATNIVLNHSGTVTVGANYIDEDGDCVGIGLLLLGTMTVTKTGGMLVYGGDEAMIVFDESVKQLKMLGDTRMWTAEDPVTPTAEIQWIGTDTDGWFARVDEIYSVRTIKLVRQHTTHDGIEFQPWKASEHDGALLPNVAGSWYLTEDVTLSEKWTVPLGTTNLCLNGCTITQTSYQNGVIEIYQNATQNATLNLYDCDETEHFGHIDGTSHLWVPDETAGEHNISIFGGCLTGGTGTESLSHCYGGGVFVKWGTFNMYGGNIVGNTSENGGGVFVHPTDGTFTMTGGAIIGNTATATSWSAGGVYVGGDNVIVGGTAKIADNFKVTGEGAVADNLYVLTTPINRKIALGEGTGSGKNGVAVPTSKMQIGVTTATVPQAGTPVIFTSNGTADDIKYFTPDNDAYDVEYNASGCLQLVIPQEEQHTTHDGIDFNKPLTLTDIKSQGIEAGNYYLTEDLELTSFIYINNKIVNLCLNGHVLKAASGTNVIRIQNGGELNLYDCGTTEHYFTVGDNGLWTLTGGKTDATETVVGGVITGGDENNWSGGGAISVSGQYLSKKSTLNMYGGNIVGNSSIMFGGGVHVNGVFHMKGGTIQGNVAPNGAGVNVEDDSVFNLTNGEIKNNCVSTGNGGGVKYNGYDDNSFIVGGSAKICDNKRGSGETATDNNVYLFSDYITLGTGTGEGGNGVAVPTEGMSIGVTTKAGTGQFTSNGTEDDVKYFTPDNDAYEVEYNASGYLQLVIPQEASHTTHDDIEFQPWVPAEHDGALLPNVAGSWYLTDNVTVNANWNAPEGTTNLCLNGKVLSLTTGKIIIPANATLNLYDCGNDAHEGYLDTSHLWTLGTGGEGTIAKTIYGGIIYPEYYGEWNNKTRNTVQVDGAFNMYGGTIAGVIDTQALGFAAAIVGTGHFAMYGGTITGNSSQDYMVPVAKNVGIINIGTLASVTIGKDAVIDENYIKTYDYVKSMFLCDEYNLVIPAGKTITLATGSNAPTEKMKVGVRSVTAPVLGTPVVFTGANAGENDASRFESNMEGVHIERRDKNALYLCVADEAPYVPHECVDHKEKQNGQAATCTADGWNDYYKCTTCETLYSDEAMTTEITDLAAWKIGAGKLGKTGHDWKYSANENVITATCQNNAAHTATLTLTAENEVFGGDAWYRYRSAGASWSDTTLAMPSAVIAYYIDNNTKTTPQNSGSLEEGSAPRNAGNYIAKATITVGETSYTIEKTFSITKAPVTTVGFKDVAQPTANTVAPTSPNTAMQTMYSGTISWSPALTNNTFGYSTVYTATVTLTANSNYRFAENVTLNALAGEGWTKSNTSTETALVFTKTYAATENAPHVCNVEKIDGQAATCTADGWDNYYRCTDTDCGKCYADEAMTTEITDLAAWKIGAGKLGKTGHDFAYSASGTDIIASCTNVNCDLPGGKITLTLTAAGGTYDGTTAFPATVTNLDAFKETTGATVGEIEYYKGGAKQNGAPTDAGNYTTKVTVTYDTDKTVTAEKAFTVEKAEQIISADAEQNFTYGDTGKFVGASATGALSFAVKSGESVTVSAAGALTIQKIGDTVITITAAATDNYNSTSKDITVKIGAKAIDKPTATTTNFVYNGEEQTYLPTGFNADTMDIAGNKQTNANETGYTVTVTPKANYAWSTEGKCKFTWKIGRKTAELQWATPSDLVYSNSAKVPTVAVTNLESGDTCTVTAGLTTANDNINVGTFTYTATALSNGNYKLSDQPNAVTSPEYTVVAKPITITGITAENKVYDGTAAATLSYDDVTFDGLVGGEALAVTATGTFANANAGTGKTVNITGITLTNVNGKDYLKNYVLAESGNQATATADITKKNVTVTITPNGGTYAGTITGAAAQFSGLVSGESFEPVLTYSGNGYNSTNVPTNAGTYTVTATLPTGASNYNLTGSTDKAFTIAKADGAVAAPTAKKLTYNGQDQALVDAGTSTTGTIKYKLGETGTYSTDIPAAKAAGDYTVYYKVVGDSNHEDVAESSVIVTIAKATYDMTGVTFTPAANVYDGAAHHPTIIGTLPTGADGVQVTVTYSEGRTDVGETEVTATFATTSGNYNTPASMTAKQTVTAKPVTLAWGESRFTYDGKEKTVSVTVGGLVSGDTCTATLTGNSAANAGDYTAEVISLSNSNYKLPDDVVKTWKIVKAAQDAPAMGEGYTISGTTLTAKSGYELYNGSDVKSTFTMAAGERYSVRKTGDGNHFASPYTAIDTKVTVSVLAVPGNMGTVTGGGSYDIGSDVTVIATAKRGYEFVEWQDMKGTQVGTTASYTIKGITAGQTLIAAFKPKDKVMAALPTVAQDRTYTGSEITGLSGGSGWTLVSGDLKGTNAGDYSAVIKLADGYDVWPDGTTADKTVGWNIFKASQNAPTGLSVTDDSIIGTANTMEYRKQSDSDYTRVTGETITGLEAGTYYVRYRETENYYASPITVVVVSEPTLNVVTLQPSDLSSTGVTFNGVVAPYDAEKVSEVGFEYVSIDKNGIVTASDPISAMKDQTFSAQVNDLTEDSDYQVRAYVKRGNTTTYGSLVAFHTPKAAPVAQDNGKIKVNATVEGAPAKLIVSIERGNDIIASQQSDNAMSSYTANFGNLPYGNYNVVVRTNNGHYTETKLLSIVDGSEVTVNFTVPAGKLAAIVEVKTPDTPKTAVDGLGEVLTKEDKDAAANGSKDVEVKLEVEKKAESNAAGAEEIKELLSGNDQILFLDMSLLKTTTELDAVGNATSIGTENIGATNDKVMEIAVPYSDTTKAPKVLRYHNGMAESLTELDARPTAPFVDGTYFVDEGYVFIYASGFSTYAISYAQSTSHGGHGGNTNVISAPTGDAGLALYAALSVSSILGMGWVGKKKRDEE